MDNIYGWYPKKLSEDILMFEFLNEEWEIPKDLLQSSDIVSDVKDIQEMCDEFYSKYRKAND